MAAAQCRKSYRYRTRGSSFSFMFTPNMDENWDFRGLMVGVLMSISEYSWDTTVSSIYTE